MTRIVANRKLPKPLPQLQRLSVLHGVHSEDSDDPEDSDASVIISNHQVDNLRKFLRIAPNLCELRIVSNIFPKIPFIIPDTAIPRLKTLIAPAWIANGIVPGRPLAKLHILTYEPDDFRENYTVVSRDIKHVVYFGLLDKPEEIFSHMAHVFPEISNVEILVRTIYEEEEISDAMLSVLPRFHHLKQCTVVYPVEKSLDEYNVVPPCCPVGRIDDPKYRSHQH